MAVNGPDLAGFRAAQDRLRSQMGADVVFHIPEEAEWAPDVPIDPETHQPYDPFASPTAGTGGSRDVTLRVIVVTALAATRAMDDRDMSPIGGLSSENIVLDIAATDGPKIAGATTVTVFGDLFKLEELRPDGLDVTNRLIAYCVKT